jgi:TatD DNase family protein
MTTTPLTTPPAEPVTPLFFDTHCHVDYIVRNGRPLNDVVADAAAVGWMVNPGTCIAQLPDVLAVAEQVPHIYAAAAIHPTDVADQPADWQAHLHAAMAHPKVVAVGETGLDYYRPEQQAPGNQALQRDCLETHLDLARQYNKPVIIHDREAHADVQAILRNHPGVVGVMHCFSGDLAFAMAMIELGYYISFAGNVTFKNATTLQHAAQQVPLERLLIETDAPFLSPMPHRGTPNSPDRVALVGQFIAGLRSMPVDELATVTTQNAKRLFKI